MTEFEFLKAALSIEFNIGIDENGNALKKKLTINNVAQNATAAQLSTFTEAIASLYDGQLLRVELTSKQSVA